MMNLIVLWLLQVILQLILLQQLLLKLVQICSHRVKRSAWKLWVMEHMVRKEIHRLSPLFLKGVYMIAMITITAIGVYTLFQMVLVVQVHHQGHNHHYHHHL
jgi:hypothetical protein